MDSFICCSAKNYNVAVEKNVKKVTFLVDVTQQFVKNLNMTSVCVANVLLLSDGHC